MTYNRGDEAKWFEQLKEAFDEGKRVRSDATAGSEDSRTPIKAR